MSYRLIVKPPAEADIADAFAWYEQQSAGLGGRFVAAVDATINSIAQLPLASAQVHGDARRAHVKKFPYAVYFLVEGDHVFVIAVVHGRRDPSVWQSRLP